MELLGLIPAREGSKGVPGKNLAPLAGAPLLEWTCAAARGCPRLTRCIVSTDSPEIAAAAESLGIEVPFLRPAALAQDETPMIDVLVHALDELGDPDGIVLLQPTSPLRTAEHIDEAIRLFVDSGADSVVSVVRVPHNFVPASLLRVVDGRAEPAGAAETAPRRQTKAVVYARNGPAVLICRPEVIRQGVLYGPDTRAYEMSAADSIDIDTPFDLELADWLLRRREQVR